MFEEIGTIKNEADEDALQILALFRESISEILLKEPEALSEYFKPEYSHYTVVHTPLGFQYPEERKEWNLRYCGDMGISIVELVSTKTGSIYVKGLMAVDGSKVYAILPFTAIDAEKARKAKFPEDRMAHMRARAIPAVLTHIEGKALLDIGSGFGGLTLEIAKNNPNSKVYGIDLYDSLIAQAQMNANVLGIFNVEFKTGSAYSLPFEENSIDTATCFFMLHHLEDIKSGLFEIKRILKKDGLLIAVEPLAHQHHHGPQLSENEWKELVEEASFHVETENLEGAVILRARK